MKTSNKLMLFLLITAIAVLSAVHLALYANYKRGIIQTEKELNKEQFTTHRMKSPKWLSLKGHFRVEITPSDSFHIDVENEHAEIDFRQTGDSLIVSGYTAGAKEPHGPWYEYSGLPRVNIFCPALETIQAEDCYLSLTNAKGLGGLAARFSLRDAQLWIGAFDPDKDSVFRTEPFDSIAIDEINSTVVINRQSAVHLLTARLDNVSEINDRYSRIDSGEIAASRYSKIYMTGANFNKIRLTMKETDNPEITPAGLKEPPKPTTLKSIIKNK